MSLLCFTHIAVWRRAHRIVNRYNEILNQRDQLRLLNVMVGHSAGLVLWCSINSVTTGCLSYAICLAAWKASEKMRIEMGLAKPKLVPLRAPSIQDTVDVLGEGEVSIKDADIVGEALKVIAVVNKKELSDL